MKRLLFTAIAEFCVLGSAHAHTKGGLGFPTPCSVTPLASGAQLSSLKEEAFDPKLLSVQGSSVLISQVTDKSIDYGFANSDLSIIALVKGEAYPIRFVYDYYTSQPLELVVPLSSPVKILADLKRARSWTSARSASATSR